MLSLLMPFTGMAAGLRSFRDTIVAFCTDVFHSVQELLLPTPETPHYVFNFRHLMRVLQGVALGHPPSVRDEIAFYELVVHETFRVFGDSLFRDSDRLKFKGIVSTVCTKRLKVSLESICPSSDTLMADFLGTGDRAYIKMQSFDEGRCALERIVRAYNADAIGANKVSLVVFDYVVAHVARICRIIQQPSGNALLVGVGGSGRRSCAKLATIAAGYSFEASQHLLGITATSGETT